MSTSPIEAFSKIIKRFKWALSSLDYMPTSNQLEKLSLLVMEGMSGPTRLYHSHDHVLNLSEDLDPLGVIAALFHDIVYYHVDGGMAPNVHTHIYPYFKQLNGILFTSDLIKDDYVYNCTLEIFGIEKGKQLLGKMQNEFLSALLALKVMSDVLSKQELLMVCACIEATIPFRAHTNALTELEEKMGHVNKKYKLGISDAEISDGIKRAVKMANKDVESFSYSDVGQFLEETWKLLPESNTRLVTTSMFTVREYRIALFKMESFLSFLDPKCIYFCYKGLPDENDMTNSVQLATNNLAIAVKYLKIKIFSTAILEALSDITGGDLPLNFLMGDIAPRNLSTVSRMEDHLLADPLGLEQISPNDKSVYYLLKHGRASDSLYDAKASPYAAFLYEYLGEEKILLEYEYAKKYFQKKISCEMFLRRQEQAMIERIAYACAQVTHTRKNRLLALKNLLQNLTD